MNRIVLAYCGHQDALTAISNAAAQPDVDVIAVVCDLGQGTSLNALRDCALAAGAVRCHALDLREEFLRDHVVPALRAGARASAAALINQKLADIAGLESATAMTCNNADVSLAQTPPPYTFEHPAYLELGFADDMPVSVNGITMTLPELVESIETIARAPAIDVLHLAYAERAQSAQNTVTFRVGGSIHVQPSVVGALR